MRTNKQKKLQPPNRGAIQINMPQDNPADADIALELPEVPPPPPPIYASGTVELLAETETPFGSLMVPTGIKTIIKEQMPQPRHPIPLHLYQQALAFMHWTFEKFNAEGMIYGFMNNEGDWRFQPPIQETQGMTVSANSSDLEQTMAQEGYTLRFTLHHHCRVAASQSGTDKASEHDQPTALHITVGDMERENYSIHSRLVVRGATVMQLTVSEDQLINFIKPAGQSGIFIPPRLIKELFKSRTVIPFPEEWQKTISRGSIAINTPGKPHQQTTMGSVIWTGQRTTTTEAGHTATTGPANGGTISPGQHSHSIMFRLMDAPVTFDKRIIPDTKFRQLIRDINYMQYAEQKPALIELLSLCASEQFDMPFVASHIIQVFSENILHQLPFSFVPHLLPAWDFYYNQKGLFNDEKALFDGKGLLNLTIDEETYHKATPFLLTCLQQLQLQSKAKGTEIPIKTTDKRWHHILTANIQKGERIEKLFRAQTQRPRLRSMLVG